MNSTFEALRSFSEAGWTDGHYDGIANDAFNPPGTYQSRAAYQRGYNAGQEERIAAERFGEKSDREQNRMRLAKPIPYRTNRHGVRGRP